MTPTEHVDVDNRATLTREAAERLQVEQIEYIEGALLDRDEARRSCRSGRPRGVGVMTTAVGDVVECIHELGPSSACTVCNGRDAGSAAEMHANCETS